VLEGGARDRRLLAEVGADGVDQEQHVEPPSSVSLYVPITTSTMAVAF
jgi:hypothetical protein